MHTENIVRGNDLSFIPSEWDKLIMESRDYKLLEKGYHEYSIQFDNLMTFIRENYEIPDKLEIKQKERYQRVLETISWRTYTWRRVVWSWTYLWYTYLIWRTYFFTSLSPDLANDIWRLSYYKNLVAKNNYIKDQEKFKEYDNYVREVLTRTKSSHVLSEQEMKESVEYFENMIKEKSI